MPAPEYTTPQLVLDRLRLTASSIDAGWITEVCTPAANELVDTWLARGDDPLAAPYPAAVVRAATGAAIRIYRFRDSETNLDESWGPEGVAVSLPRDPLAGYVDLLAPYRLGAAWAPA